MDVLALIAFLISMLIFAIQGFAANSPSRFINVASGLFFLTLALVLAALGLTDTNV